MFYDYNHTDIMIIFRVFIKFTKVAVIPNAVIDGPVWVNILCCVC